MTGAVDGRIRGGGMQIKRREVEVRELAALPLFEGLEPVTLGRLAPGSWSGGGWCGAVETLLGSSSRSTIRTTTP